MFQKSFDFSKKIDQRQVVAEHTKSDFNLSFAGIDLNDGKLVHLLPIQQGITVCQQQLNCSSNYKCLLLNCLSSSSTFHCLGSSSTCLDCVRLLSLSLHSLPPPPLLMLYCSEPPLPALYCSTSSVFEAFSPRRCTRAPLAGTLLLTLRKQAG